MSLYLGIDIGGTKIAGGLVTDTGQVIVRAQCPTPAKEGGKAVLTAALNLGQSLAVGKPVLGVGIGTGGQVDARRGVVISATGLLPGWAGTDLKSTFEEALGVPTSADNDVNALAVGEAHFGAARGLSTVVFLALGTGVGGALLLNGHLHHGAHWSGGEFGHLLLTLPTEARRDKGGAAGTLEAYVSGPGLAETYREMTGSLLTGEQIAEEAMRDPASAGAQALHQTGEYLGYSLVSLANALDPDMIVIGGGLAALGDLLLDPARAVLREYALPGPATCPVVTATLGAEASLIGAAALAMPSPISSNENDER